MGSRSQCLIGFGTFSLRHVSFNVIRFSLTTYATHIFSGQETAEMLEPFWKPVTILGLGDSVGTPEVGITAPVLVVKDFKELEAKNASVPGKIVVYNPGWINDYGTTVEYRAKGAATASKYGAVAALMESVAPYSLNTPHTGGQHAYPEDIKQIPGASITKEDADMLYRLQNKLNGTDIKMHIKMLDYNLPETISRNVIGELKGKVMETEYVALSGHIDAWDVGQGAMDDAGGVMISVMALAALKQMNLQPYRTLQAILWTSEEAGLIGVQEFAKQHMDILANYSVMFESDSGTFKPKGLDFAGNETAGCMVNEILKLVNDTLGPMEYNRRERVSSDISVLQEYGVPGLDLNNENDKYFYYHHSPADTMYMMSSEDLDLDTALFAITSYVLADLPFMLPRDNVPAP